MSTELITKPSFRSDLKRKGDNVAFERYFDKMIKAKREYAFEARNIKTSKVRNLIRQLVNLKSEQELNDDEFARLMEVVVSNYIENQIQLRVSEQLNSQLSKLFLIRS